MIKLKPVKIVAMLVALAVSSAALVACKVEISTEGFSDKEPRVATGGPSPVARVMTYNIQFLNEEAATHGNRIEKLRKLINDINPTVVAVQEVDNRAAMELVFPPGQWQVVIDDDSDDNQDTAFAVSKEWQITDIAKDLDADDENFLAEGREHESYYVNRRDGLFINLKSRTGDAAFTAVNIHAKARVGGRPATDHRREGASRILVDIIRNGELKGRNVVVMGDFNDTPDDASLNILETGNPDEKGQAENEPGTFLVNLTEPLWEMGMVSHGASAKRLDRATGLINNIYPEARDRNNRTRGREAGTGPVLLDNILVSAHLKPALLETKATIYRKPIALEGPGYTRTSDHLPVYADIDFNKLPD